MQEMSESLNYKFGEIYNEIRLLIANTIHAHPTVSESMMEAAEGVHDLTIHM